MAGGAGDEVVVGKHLVKRRKANSLEAIEGLADKERKILELDSEGEDDMEPDESMAARDRTLLEQVDTDMAELKCGEDGDEVVSWEDLMVAQSRRMDEQEAEKRKRDAEERKREICAKLPLIPFQRYTYQYHQEEETESARAAKEQMALEEREFDVYRSSREFSLDGSSFDDMTTLSPMYFTHWTPKRIPFMLGTATIGSSLQIYSFEIQMKDEKLNWPLYVYGVVAARDCVDRSRNLLFYRPRHDCQILTQDDQALRLTGPSRAIFSSNPVDFEVQLKLKGSTKSRDRPLMNQRYTYYYGYTTTGSISIKLENCECAAELSLDNYPETVQATVLGVRVVEGSLFPFRYGGRVVCYSPPEERLLMGSQGTVDDVVDLSKEILLLDSHDFDGVEMPIDLDGYFDLSRRVVSVQWKESLKVVIQAYSESLAKNRGKKDCLKPEDIAAKGHVKFRSKYCNISQGMCDLGDSKVEVTVAWSAIVTSKSFLSLMC